MEQAKDNHLLFNAFLMMFLGGFLMALYPFLNWGHTIGVMGVDGFSLMGWNAWMPVLSGPALMGVSLLGLRFPLHLAWIGAGLLGFSALSLQFLFHAHQKMGTVMGIFKTGPGVYTAALSCFFLIFSAFLLFTAIYKRRK